MSVDGDHDGDAGTRPSAARSRDPAPAPDLLDRVPLIVYVSAQGSDGGWEYVSPQIEAILGYAPREWCADPTLWRRRLHPDDAPRVLAGEDDPNLDAAGNGAVEYRLLHRDGHAVWVRDDALLVVDDAGHRRWHGALTDITDRKLAEIP